MLYRACTQTYTGLTFCRGTDMRICSLLPSATEMVYALGLGDDLVGVSYACDYPDEAASLPVVSHSLRNIKHLDSGQIDALVQQARANNNPMYWIDEELLADLRPDLIITQELCEVCAIASGSVFETAAKVLDYQPEILTIRPSGVDDILQNVSNLANAAGVPERGRELRGVAGSADCARYRRCHSTGSGWPGGRQTPARGVPGLAGPAAKHRAVAARNLGDGRRRGGPRHSPGAVPRVVVG